MDICRYMSIAIRVHGRTISMIQALDSTVTLEGNEDKYFMIYCADSDHEEYQTIDKETYNRTYEAMPPYVYCMNVVPID